MKILQAFRQWRSPVHRELDLIKLAALVILGALGGLIFSWSGLFNITASSGHWGITSWFLHFTMRQSVGTHAFGIDPPPLDDIALVQRGAGHFETGCAPCHGAPGTPRSPIVRSMTPEPPDLAPKVPEWKPSELFWIVKHGVKFTGMPAWPALERDDEVWAMVAFLRRLPSMEAGEYRGLAFGGQAEADTAAQSLAPMNAAGEPPESVLANCARCHGLDGKGRAAGAFPRLDGQSETYLFLALRSYARGARPSGIMEPMTSGLTDDELARLARHYAIQPGLGAIGEIEADAEVVAAGRTLARHGSIEHGVPACASCHGPSTSPRNPAYPLLAGQSSSYIASQLKLWRSDVRGGGPFAHVMAAAARRLTDEQIAALAAYYSSAASD